MLKIIKKYIHTYIHTYTHTHTHTHKTYSYRTYKTQCIKKHSIKCNFSLGVKMTYSKARTSRIIVNFNFYDFVFGRRITTHSSRKG